jgi:PhnB protein
MRIGTHLTFGGQCADAFRFYERLLGGKLDMLAYGDSPMAAEVAPEERGWIVHATLSVGSAQLMGADVHGHEPARGFFALLAADDLNAAERIFAALADGGEVRMPLQKTFWSPAFGVVVDRFGTPWEITV